MTNPADLCRECEVANRNKELERRLSEMAIEVVVLEEENRALKEALTWACNRLHQWSPWNNGCHFRACGECPLKGYAKEEAE